MASLTINSDQKKNTVIHILWDGDFGGIQRIVKSVFLDDASFPFRHITIIAGQFGRYWARWRSLLLGNEKRI